MTIGQLAAESDVPASTIRYYEKIGVLPAPSRVSGQRRYGSGAVERLAVLRLARECGFRLDEMRELLHGFRQGVAASARWRKLATRKREEIDLQIERLASMRSLVDRVLSCQCVELAECGRIASAARSRGGAR
jgi:DNA-binding transcriptional MerR regulator